ncbi:MAG: carbohydrate ABC transporter permease [Ferrovibrio sp.]|uniref:carbohydrate ABC transporter permease n=1 Tax=Ferrovibrio sp. TaxID=1917215 RepID=UPI003919B4BD
MAEVVLDRVSARGWRIDRSAVPYLLAGPAFVLMLLLLIGPVLTVLLLSFTDYQLGAPGFGFIGLDNYTELAGEKVFWKSLGNTLAYVGVVVPAAVGLGLGVALLIESGRSWRAFYRAAFFVPVMATLIAMAIAWEFMLHPQFGLINLMLKPLGIAPQNWLNDPGLALWVLAVIGIWQSFGFNMVLFMAGIVSIPKHLYEAAEMDGARSAWERFRLVTWPMLGPVTMFVVVITAIRSFQVFDTVHALTKGGPVKATEVLLYTMYAEGFEFLRSGYAAAIAVVFLVFVLILTVIKARLLDRKVHYG